MNFEKLFAQLQENGGFTVDKTGNATNKEGYAVAVTGKQVICENNFESFKTESEKFLSELHPFDDGAFFGGWLNSEDGKIYLDKVAIFANLNTALYFGKKFEQIAIYDLVEKVEIPC